jgi:crotonobetainyl-CoA:carnitine CoA-transferase CaiB-like acyl-CoA transferase
VRFFEELTVVALTQGWVGPLVTRILSDLGANVIRVERAFAPDGIYTNRTLFPPQNDVSGEVWNRNIYFTVRNAGARSALIDLRSDEGRELLLQIVADSDILVENFTPGAVARLGLDFEELHRRFPRLLMLSISGFGQTGPYTARPANGMTMEAAIGVPTVTGHPGDGPTKTGQTWVDPYSGLHGTAALIAALIHRERTGEGQIIDVSMHEAPLAILESQYSNYQRNGRHQARNGNRRPGMIRGAYPCRGDDDWVAISIRNESEWQKFCRTSGHANWLEDSRFTDTAARTQHHDILDTAIGEWTHKLTKFEVADLLQTAGVPAGPILKADEVVSDPHLAAREFFDELPVGDYGRVPIQRYLPAKFDGQGVAAAGPAPDLGADTEAVLAEIGLSDTEISELLERNIIDNARDLKSNPVAREGNQLPIEDYERMGSVLRIDREYKPKPI